MSSSSGPNVSFEELHTCMQTRDSARFGALLDEHPHLLDRMKPHLINEILQQCIRLADADLIETFMLKLYSLKCFFLFSDEACKSVVRLYAGQHRQFSPHSVNCLLRCYDLDLVKRVFEFNLVSDKCSGDCSNWDLMFVASYQERFFTHYFDTIFEGFLARFVLLCKLRCSLSQKRFFLTWFSGSLHLYTDEYFLQNEESRFKYVLVKLFESLILNGLVTNVDFVNLSKMLAKRNEELVNLNMTKFYTSDPAASVSTVSKPIVDEDCSTSSKFSSTCSSYFPHLDTLFPLSLKNACRLATKRSMVKYTKTEIDKLPLPTNLKRFVFFEHECESIYKCFEQIKK